MIMRYQDITYLSGSSQNSPEDAHLFAAAVPEAEFNLDEAVRLACEWRNTHGADAVKIRRQYVVGRFENKTLFAVVTVPCYRLGSALVESEEFFRSINDLMK